MQKSTSLVKFFALYAALRLKYEDEEIGDLLFQMIHAAGLGDRHPVSPEQLTPLLKLVSGQARQIMPYDLGNNICLKLGQYYPRPWLYNPIEHVIAAKLLVGVCKEMRDDAIANVCVVGSDGGLWLATALMWCFGEEACLYINEDLAIGNPTAKLVVTLCAESEADWRIKTWREISGLSTFVVQSGDHVEEDTSYLETNQVLTTDLKQYFEAIFPTLCHDETWGDPESMKAPYPPSTLQDLSWYADGPSARATSELTGQVAVALTSLLVKRVKLVPHQIPATYEGQCDSLSKTQGRDRSLLRSAMKLCELVDSALVSNPASCLTQYGWSMAESNMTLHEDLQMLITKFEAVTDWDEFRFRYDITDVISQRPIIEDVRQASIIMRHATHLAVDAILTCVVQKPVHGRYVRIRDTEQEEGNTARRFNELVAGPMRVSTFRENVMDWLIPGASKSDHQDLVRSGNGIVVGAASLWRTNTDPREAVAIRMVNGSIQWNGRIFSSVMEAMIRPARNLATDDCPVIAVGTVMAGMPHALQCPFDLTLQPQMSVAAQRSILLLQTSRLAMAESLSAGLEQYATSLCQIGHVFSSTLVTTRPSDFSQQDKFI